MPLDSAVIQYNRGMTDQQLDALKIPPHSVEAEQSVIGGLLLENEALDKVADILTAKDFYRHDHKLIFQHIADNTTARTLRKLAKEWLTAASIPRTQAAAV